FIRTCNETFFVAPVRVSNPDCSPLRIYGCDAAPTPAGLAEIVGDDFPVLHEPIGRLRTSHLVSRNGCRSGNSCTHCRYRFLCKFPNWFSAAIGETDQTRLN